MTDVLRCFWHISRIFSTGGRQRALGRGARRGDVDPPGTNFLAEIEGKSTIVWARISRHFGIFDGYFRQLACTLDGDFGHSQRELWKEVRFNSILIRFNSTLIRH